MENEQTRWGGEFGSGNLVTKEIWEIITVLTSLPEDQRAGIEYLYAMAVAWFNGCPRPKRNIDANKDGALANAYGDGSNNFLYGVLVDLARRKPNPALYDDLTKGSEAILEGAPIEEDHVPASYRLGGYAYGFTRSAPYAITSGILKAVEASQHRKERFCELLGILDEGIARADDLEQLARYMKECIGIHRG